ncbi:MAG: cytochrome c bioproteinis protein CcmG thiol:disulfide interchange protein DsbE [Gammaproteobacteria bacterium]|nr:MAG: cytochrome c bioproteinis protein CcmG thiol:disulfide interchange protein DsbE [Gammaproteobacteria bacterium]TND06209.1 MAG: cytochrome c bioproteinis protein CcmG, thiol:disulfide interchange protein DsbE [Gammaproteobacteria bacterium]
MMKARFFLPLLVFAVLVVFLYVGLSLKPSEVPSPLIGKAAPAFALPAVHHPEQTIAREDMLGQVWLLNVWASWCVTCRQEHPLLVRMAREKIVPIYGLNYKDTRADAIDWLNALGNPYITSLFDEAGQVGIDFGVYGVPETFVIDKRGVIRYKHIGALTDSALREKILPLVRELNS